MKRALTLAAIGCGSLVCGSVLAAPETGARPRRVLVGGPADDAITARVQKELTALGFETVRVGALDRCTRAAVENAAAQSSAVAATCSDGEQVGVWVLDGGVLRLREVVVGREEGGGGRARENTAVRAAEVTRATLALREANEDEARKAPEPSATPVALEVKGPGERDQPSAARASAPSPRRTPIFLGSVGAGALMGIDASVATFSAQLEVGVLRYLSAAARLEYPLESQEISRFATPLQVSPAFAGAGVNVPIAAPSAFMIPRFGGGVGVAWVKATRPEAPAPVPIASNADGSTLNFGPTRTGDSDTVASPAAYGNAGLSMRVVGPVRLMVDGIFGATASRLVVRDVGTHLAYWGQPFAALSIRAEVMLP